MFNLACVVWWLIPGMFLGWLLSWIFDLLFRRDGVPFIEKAKAETEAIQVRAAGLESDLVASRNQFSSQATALNGLKSQFADVQQSRGQLEAALAKSQSELAESMAANAKFRADIAADAKHDAAADAEIARLRTELAESSSAGAKLRADLSAHAGEITRLRSELAQSVAANEKFRADVAADEKRDAAADAEIVRLRRELEASVAANEKFRADFAADAKHDAAADAEIARLRNELAESTAANINYRDQLMAAVSARDGVANSLSLMEQQRSQATAALANLGGEADGLRQELAAVKVAHAQDGAKLTALVAEAGTLRAQANGSADAAAKLKAQLGELEKERDVLQKDLRELHALRIEHAKAVSAADALALQHKAVAAQHEESKHMIALLHAEIEGNKRSLAAVAGRVSDAELAAQRAAERRNAMTRYGFVSNVHGRDDLTLVEGIGPKSEEVLHAAGVNSFAKLAVTPVEDLRALLDSAGTQFRILNPGTWPRQAALIVKDDWAELRRWQDELIAGVEVPKAGA